MSHARVLLLAAIFVLVLGVVLSPVESFAAQLTLTWTDNSTDEDGFKIERDAGPTGTFVQITTVGPNFTSYIDSGLASATTYCYRVRAYNTAGDSAYSNQSCGTTPQTFGLAVVRAGTGSGTVTSSPAGITCGTSCSANYASGTAVTLTATPASGSTFTGWTGGGCAGTGSCIVTVTATTTVTATFNVSPTLVTLTVIKTGTGSGTVTSAPAGITCGTSCAASYASGTGVTLTATPASGSNFGGWSGGGCAGTGSCNVTLSSATTVTATFTSSTSSTLSTENVIWTNPINVTPNGSSIQKTSGCDGCEDAGSISQQQILSGDGYLQFTASETTTLRYVGLSTGDTGTSSAEIRFAIKLESGIAEVRESGTARTTTGFVTGDVFRISVTSGVVKYYKNGVLFYTSGLVPPYPLLVDSSLASLNATISNVVISGLLSTLTVVNDTTAPVISAVAAVNVGASGATITWTTNEASDSQVEYGPTTAYGSSTARNSSLVMSHSQALSGLAPSTLYHYRVKSRDAATNLATSSDKTFMTAAPPPPPSPPKKKKEGFFDSIMNFFKHLF